ncbi:hypothetical protein MSUIS_06670 [Mycoplasma suis KI3806]|uniref:Uncharacterized protein n=1 Tax=Mycoplasma suis (strain KI_3806) TaxID=708248 RepID=F0V279_MYCS3|nr:hypothetical protein [Mycoplasma suis]CBZ40760.1 hypothetical protein MSUIS_06670 [Mycoplasma suis KI3806]
MIGGLATKALVLVVGLGAGLGAGEIGSMYNYDETIDAHNQGNKIFNKVQLTTISQEPGHGIKVGSDKQHIGGWEDKTRVGGKAKGGGQVGENDVDIIFTQNRLKKSDGNGTNGHSSGKQNNNQNGFGKTTKGVSNRHICILLGKQLVNGWVNQQSNGSDSSQSGKEEDACWNFSPEVSKTKGNGNEWYDIKAKGQNGSKVFLDSTTDPHLGVLEINPSNNKVTRALGRKGWILGLKVSDPKKWCHVHHEKDKDQWRGNSLNAPGNKRNSENMKKIGFDFLRQSVMVWYENNGTMTYGWGPNQQNGGSGQQGKKYMQVINCYKV